MNMCCRLTISVIGVVIFGSIIGPLSSADAAPIPILQYKFDETGTGAPSTGSDTTGVTMRNDTGVATDLHSAGGVGVSGAATDRAFDNSASTGMGQPTSGNVGGYANQGDNNAVDSLQSLTLQGWYNSAVSPADGARLFSKSTGTNGFELLGATGGNLLTLTVNGNFANSAASYTNVNTWAFFAVTFDGASGVVKFYKGTTSSAVALVGTGAQTIVAGTIADSTAGLTIGNYQNPGAAQRPLDGLMDDMRVFGSKTDSSGVLTLAQLEAVRTADITVAAPEPTAGLLLVTAGLLIGGRGRRLIISERA